MSEVRLGINGFGRIGRCVFRQALEDTRHEVVGVNDLARLDDLAYLLRHDSVHGAFPGEATVEKGGLRVGDAIVPFSSHESPSEIPWDELGADVVIESTGAFRSREDAAQHLAAGARTVLVSAPSDDADLTVVPGVNQDDYDPKEHEVVSLASCTTNCLAPVAKVLHESFGVERLLMTTVHAYTASQSLLDKPTRKRRRGRAAALSIIPTTTGAAQATQRVLPELEGRMHGLAMRVPIPDGSITDIVASLKREVSSEEINDALRTAASSPPLEGILGISDEALVSADIVGNPHSAVIDAEMTSVIDGRLVKVLAWYDNEWGYAARLIDFAAQAAGRSSS